MKVRGFTLTETLFAIALLSMIVLVVMNLFLSAAQSVQHAANRSAANNLASSTLAGYASRPFSDLSAQGPREIPAAASSPFHTFVTISAVQPPSGETGENLRSIQVSVSWSEEGIQKSLHRKIWRTRVGE